MDGSIGAKSERHVPSAFIETDFQLVAVEETQAARVRSGSLC